MATSSVRDAAYLQHVKEYARFCRIRGLFMIDSLGLWQDALKVKGVAEGVIRTKVKAARQFISSMQDPLSEPRKTITLEQ